MVDQIQEVVEARPNDGDTRITDLRAWRVGKQAYSCALTVVTHARSFTLDTLRKRLFVHQETFIRRSKSTTA